MVKKSASPSKPNSPTPAPVTTVTVSPVSVTLPHGILGKGLWGIVGKNSRYSTVTQFSGLEYVRYEYRRIPEEFRDAAFVSTFLEVVEIFDNEGSLPVMEIETPAEIPAVVEPTLSDETPLLNQDPAEEEILEG